MKNNLQLISSILNMQMRSVPEGQGKRVLGRVQDRVMSLSSIHKALYSGTDVDNVRVDTLLSDVVSAAFTLGLPAGSGVKTDKELAPVYLDADQAVPVALLTNELVTNAVKYVGRPKDGGPVIRVRLDQQDNEICLSVENTLGEPLREDLQDESTGLGGRLIDAFVTQLGAAAEQTEGSGFYRVRVCFRSLSHQTEAPSVRDQVAKEVATLRRTAQA
ncbi:sensor histidine kinase [Tropicimonas sp. S265A]|uniref:sensor histidine kinase n=1 Tax=Tropicimonas sp. S265A TaxID=3415134 RepID=UPI003C7B3AC1